MVNFGISCKDKVKYIYVADSVTGEAYSIPFVSLVVVKDTLWEREVSFQGEFGSCNIYTCFNCITGGHYVTVSICGVRMRDFSKKSYTSVYTLLDKVCSSYNSDTNSFSKFRDFERNIYLSDKQFYITSKLGLYTSMLVQDCSVGKYVHGRKDSNSYYVAQWFDTLSCRDVGLYFHTYYVGDSNEDIILTCQSIRYRFSVFFRFNRRRSIRLVSGGGNVFRYEFICLRNTGGLTIDIAHNDLLINNVPFVLTKGEAKSLKKFLSRLVDNKV